MGSRGFYIFVIFLLIVACNKEQFYSESDARLDFSTDTVSFDTVFTTQGTATYRLKVYNPFDKILQIPSIELAGGDNSPFILNINGIKSTRLNDVEIYPKDSLYIFVQVFINPTGQDAPLFIRDSIVFTLPGKVQDVKLLAYGQDVHLIKDKTLATTTWPADKPYLVFGNVAIDSLQTLTIEEGATIHFHKNANLIVKGTLIAQGSIEKPVVFRGDRLEKDYKDIPGQWGTLIFMQGSSNHRLNWCIVENGTSGIWLGDYKQGKGPDLELSNSIIRNMSYNGLYGINATVKAYNCLINNASNYTCGFEGGGTYEFYHCTIANHYERYLSRKISSVTVKISNFFSDPNDITIKVPNNLTKADFFNTIIYGGNQEEISIDSVTTAGLSYKFDHCLLKSEKYEGLKNSRFIGNIWNEYPEFKPKSTLAFQLDTLSPAKDKGRLEIGESYPLDLKNVSRLTDGKPDIGVYERVEKK